MVYIFSPKVNPAVPMVPNKTGTIIVGPGVGGRKGETGPQGPTGPTGPQGPQGIPGTGGDLSYEHIQSIASDTWNVTHNLGKIPSVAVVNSANDLVYGEIKHIDLNNAQLKFVGAFSGKAYFN